MDHARKLQYAEFFAQIQSAQDLLADQLGICLVLLDARGKEITLPSGLPLVCNQHQDSATCHADMIGRVGIGEECVVERCPKGMYVGVVETSIRTDDGNLYLLAGRTAERPQAEQHLELLNAIYTLPFETPFNKRKVESAQSGTPGDVLTAQENKVLACIVAGLTNKDIANRLCISQSTVKAHVGSLLKKLNLSNRTEASVYALKNGIHLDEAGV